MSSAASEDTPPSADAHLHSGVFEMSMSSSRKSILTSSLEVTSEPTNSEPTPSPPTTTTNLVTSDPVNPKPVITESPNTDPSTAEPCKSPLTSEPSEPVTPDPDSSKRASHLVKRDGSKRLSKKEKRFQLSKDDGKYAELNPINPHDAKKEFGEKLRLNPVGPAFGSVASAGGTLEEGQVITSHNTSSVPGPEGSELLLCL